jgi:two-component system chemotaxis response regulator CheY
VRILIADDSATPRLILKRELEKLGHECRVAKDGIQAWDAFRQGGAEVVISDWMMPGMDGPELCRRLRADASAPYAYFIILTSLEDRESVVEGMQAGADDFLTKAFSHDELKARLIAAERVTELHRRLAHQQAELGRLNAELFGTSRTDYLTGVGNRLRQDEDLAVLGARARRYGQTFCVALFDVDRFKAYNDTFGHLAGDEALRSIAETFVAESRDVDTVYRYGGEELLIVFPEQELDQAAVAAERVRSKVEALAIPHAHGVVTVSAGIAAVEPGDGADVGALLKRADASLYEAKESGRNRVVVSSRSVSPA